MTRPAYILLFVATIYLLGFFTHALYLKKTVYGDGIFYYSWLRSIVIDQDINFINEYDYFHVQQPKTSKLIPGNKYSVGPALLWLPTFLSTHMIFRSDGYDMWYQSTTGVVSVFFVCIGLLLLFRLLREEHSQTVSMASILALAFATNLFFYGSVDTVNSHSLSFFAACFYLSLFLAKRKNFFFIGIALGLLSLIRIQDIIFAILLFPFLSWKNITLLLIGFLLTFSPQLMVWQTLYGQFWISPYLTGGEGFNFLQPHMSEVLFSPKSGLFSWTPILILGIVGLIRSSIIPAKAGIHQLFLFAILLQIFIVASWSTWWQGASYGGRMFISTLPLFTFGLASIFNWLQSYGWKLKYFLFILIAPLSVLNMLFIIFFLLRT